MTERIVQRNVIELWANQHTQVMRWLSKLQRKKESALRFYRFCKWCGKTPEELLTLKERDFSDSPPPNIVEKILDKFVSEETTDFTNSKKFNISIAVKSFFNHNYRELAKASGAVSLEKVKPYNPTTKENLRKLWDRALNPRDRALIPFVASTAIAKETLSNLTWGHLEADWETKDLPCINIGPELLKGHGKGRYKGVRQITFLTPEAKRELLVYRDWIEEKLGRKVKPEDHIWLKTCKPYEPLTYLGFGNLIIALSKNAGIPFSWHDGRRVVNTALEQIGISSNWARKIRGRKVKGEEAPYSQPAIEQLRAKFKEAVPLLQFIEAQTDQESRLRALEEFRAGLTAEQLAAGRRAGLIMRKKENVGKEDKDETDCEDGEHCGRQKVVSEGELENYLGKGWQVVTALPSGKIVIKS